ncbi:MAG: hypothetical protein CVU44_20610 [Chloroflexi bacterium HGW-Chloroflexi-6]|nr:MAG: hypothetical protein CVU44_20610 [Chloroflexi bacterium HGW-Chloroflexi-6]
MLEFLRWFAAILVLFTSVTLLLSRDWRWSLGVLAAQYLAIFLLFLIHWPLTMSAAKLVTGWMAAAILGVTLVNQADFLPVQSSRIFKFLLALVVAGAVIQGVLVVNDWIPDAGFPLVLASLMLIGQGLLQLGMTVEPFRATLGLLTVLSGFELLSAPLDNSVLVTAMLAAATLGIALAGSYLLTLQLTPAEESLE